MPSHCIDFVDEDNARSILLALLKQIAYPARAHTHKHLHEVRTRDREERNVRLTRHRSRQQSLARSRRSNQQHALGNASTELLKLLRLAQELDNLAQLFLGLFYSGNVFKSNFFLLHR